MREENGRGKYRRTLIFLLLLLGGGLGTGSFVFFVVGGEEGKKIWRGDFSAFGVKKNSVLAGKNSDIINQSDLMNQQSARTDENSESDVIPKKLLIPSEIKGLPALSVSESSLSLVENGSVEMLGQSGVSVDQAVKSGQIRFLAKSGSRAKRPDPPTISEGGMARAVPVSQSGLKPRTRMVTETKK